MDIENNLGQYIAPPNQQAAAPPAPAQTHAMDSEDGGTVTTNIAAVTTHPPPEVPLPIPATPSQTGLVSQSALPKEETAQRSDASGISAAERTLKPYGISMLPEKSDPDPLQISTQD